MSLTTWIQQLLLLELPNLTSVCNWFTLLTLSVTFTTPTEIEYNAVNDILVQDMLWSDVLMLQDIILCFQYIISSLRLQLTVAQLGITMRFVYKYCINY